VPHSKIAEELREIEAAAVAAMTPAELVELAYELGRRGVELYMTAHHVDYETAARELERAGVHFRVHGTRSLTR
jgi:urease accessory protein UreE